MIERCNRHNIGLRKILTENGGVLLQMLITISVIVAGISLELGILQWMFVILTSSVFLFISVYRSAAMLLLNVDRNVSSNQAIRVKAMSNTILAITGGITFFTYLLVFMPSINQLL